MISLASEPEPTLFFDFLPVDMGTIPGIQTSFTLYTLPRNGVTTASPE